MPRPRIGEKREKLLAIRVTKQTWDTLDKAWHLQCANGESVTKEAFLEALLLQGLQSKKGG